ncbi:MAG: MopE-related protein, partial [Actinomycetota bacterium]|nr:MopE-related protein [Actinomycetota bacterium]
MGLSLVGCFEESDKPEQNDSIDTNTDTDTDTDTDDDTASPDPLDVDDDGDGQTENQGDCDDSNADIYTGADETCDGVDNNCSGDETDATDALTWYADADGDTHGDPNNSTQACDQPSGYVFNTNDCNDSEPLAWTSATDTCDGVDNNCSGDELDATDALTWYADADGDGFGDPNSTIQACEVQSGYADNTDDCDDSDAFVSPDATDYCDGIDNNCSGDETDCSVAPDFYLHPNGVTVMCPSAAVGDTGVINGVTYTKRDRAALDALIDAGGMAGVVQSCTSGITDMSLLFHNDPTFNGDITSWDTSTVTNMSSMFNHAESFNQDI